MKKYEVEVTFTGHYTITVEANNPGEACDIAQNSEEYENLDWNDAGSREIAVAYADEVED